jgi:MFS family permease
VTTKATANQPESIRLSSALGRWVLFATVLASGMTFLDATVVNLALPRIGREFGVGLADLQWTVSSYALTLSAFLLLGGALGDRYGRRRLFLTGLTWFTLASALCAVAPSAPVLIGSRAWRGLAAHCSPRAAWRSSRPPSSPPIGVGRSAPGPGLAACSAPSARCSAGSWSRRCHGAWSS